MKKLIILSILCALTLSTYSQNIFNKKPQQERVSLQNLLHENGKTYYEGKLFAGIAYKEYYNNQLQGEWNFIDGEINGEAKAWYENGKLMMIGNIKIVNDEIVSGEGKTLYESGQVKKEEKWEDRKLIYEKCFNLEGIEIDCHIADDGVAECADNCQKACCLGCQATEGDAACLADHSCCVAHEAEATEGEEEVVEDDNLIYEESNILPYPLADSQNSENIHILEIERSSANYFDTTTVTKIHFIYTCSDLYLNGGWFNINSNIKIKDSYGDQQYSLLKAIGIPLSPEMEDCDFQNQIHSFMLIFEAIDSDITMIDIIECEDTSCFNFYGVNLEYTEE